MRGSVALCKLAACDGKSAKTRGTRAKGGRNVGAMLCHGHGECRVNGSNARTASPPCPCQSSPCTGNTPPSHSAGTRCDRRSRNTQTSCLSRFKRRLQRRAWMVCQKPMGFGRCREDLVPEFESAETAACVIRGSRDADGGREARRPDLSPACVSRAYRRLAQDYSLNNGSYAMFFFAENSFFPMS